MQIHGLLLNIVTKIQYGKISFEIYINGVKQNIYIKTQNILYDTSNILLEYNASTFTYGPENTALYIGGFNPKNNSNIGENNYVIGSALTFTCYANSIENVNPNTLLISPINSIEFNKYF